MPSRRLPIGENTKPSSDGPIPVARRYTRGSKVADDILAVVADQRSELLLLVLLAHGKQSTRQIAPAVDRAILATRGFQSANLAIRHIVDDVLEGGVATDGSRPSETLRATTCARPRRASARDPH